MKGRSQSFSIRTRLSKSRRSSQEEERRTKRRVLRELKNLANPKVRAKMAYFGVNVPNAHGISVPVLHALAKRIGRNHGLAQDLWETGIHEARILATLIGESEKVTAAEMERWA